jgi:hypothetical protein
MSRTIAYITVAVLLFSTGCIIPIFTTPTRHEKKVPAEYNLTLDKGKKIAVMVDNPIWSRAPISLTSQLTTAITKNLTDELGLKSKYLISDAKVQAYRATMQGSSQLSPVELGRAVGADFVLFAQVQEYELIQTAETEYYKGLLAGKAVLFDVAAGQKLWPESESGKPVRVAFDIEKGSHDDAVERLVNAFAHCVTRYLYDCPVPKFKIFEDKSGTGWNEWQD